MGDAICYIVFFVLLFWKPWFAIYLVLFLFLILPLIGGGFGLIINAIKPFEKEFDTHSRVGRIYIAIVGVLLLGAAIMFCLQPFSDRRYIASVNQPPFHRLSCEAAKKIRKFNVVYYKTRKEAINDGHRPCRICNP